MVLLLLAPPRRAGRAVLRWAPNNESVPDPDAHPGPDRPQPWRTGWVRSDPRLEPASAHERWPHGPNFSDI